MDCVDCCCPGKPEVRQHKPETPQPVDQMETQVYEEGAEAKDLDMQIEALEKQEQDGQARTRARNRMQQISDHIVATPMFEKVKKLNRSTII